MLLSLLGYTFSVPKTLTETDCKSTYTEVERDMSKYVGIQSEVKDCGGVPALYVNGEPFTSVAYMTYLEDFNKYDDFADAGYNFFSVPVLFAGRWINAQYNLNPFKSGIFDKKGSPDFSLMDEAVNKILKACPNAYIIPRVNISMPEWWEKENPNDVNILSDGSTRRESFYSQKWRDTAAEMLRQFVKYVNGTDYASHIAGYQIAGGNTEEWFHFDLNGGCCKNAENGFKAFLEKYYPETEFRGLPDLKKLNKSGNYIKDEYLTRFLEYASFAVADAITYFASVVKQESGNNVVVGAFYGYTLEVTDPLYGVHALKIILDSPNIDFICSPNSYIGTRGADCDWTEMYPADSVRLHGKMCFQECDVRTHLTTLLSDHAPEIDPDKVYSDNAIWQFCGTKEQAQNLIRKSFCRQLVKGNGLWWFDMWGGWYADEDIMNEMAQYRYIYSDSLKCADRSSKAEVAVFVDESAYKYLTNGEYRNVIYNQRKALGLMGTGYDMFDVFDFEAVYKNYKAVIFMSGTKTELMKKAVSLCKQNDVSYIMSTALKKNFTVKELRAFCEKSGVHIYCDTDDIVYVNENYAAIYACSDGEKKVSLGGKYKISGLINADGEYTSDTITVRMKKGEAKLFGLKCETASSAEAK